MQLTPREGGEGANGASPGGSGRQSVADQEAALESLFEVQPGLVLLYQQVH